MPRIIRNFVGQTPQVSSPQGRFKSGARVLNGRQLTGVDAHGKHLLYDWDGKMLHIHLGLYRNLRRHKSAPPEPRVQVRIRVIGDNKSFGLNGPTACELLSKAKVKALRDYLTANGYYGGSANMLKLDLKALERPGWVQVFDFHVHAKREEGNWEELCGVIRSDERSDLFEVTLYDNFSRNDVVQRATDGMITAQRGPRHWSYWPLMTLVALVFGTAIVGAVLSPEGATTTTPESVKAEAP